MERDACEQTGKLSDFISTHTLTWSVTVWGKCEQIVKSHISTHTLTWSVTYQHLTLLSQFDISTHTLTWSVTQKMHS